MTDAAQQQQSAPGLLSLNNDNNKRIPYSCCAG